MMWLCPLMLWLPRCVLMAWPNSVHIKAANVCIFELSVFMLGLFLLTACCEMQNWRSTTNMLHHNNTRQPAGVHNACHTMLVGQQECF